MFDIINLASEISYAGIFLLLIFLNTIPILVPPTWIVLSSFHIMDPSLNPFVLALVGATAATLGRFVLKNSSVLLCRFTNKQQQISIQLVDKFFKSKWYSYPLISFLFAATPLPSNMLFVAYGIIKTKSLMLYIGFWCGRVLSYYIMISISNIVLAPFIQIFEDRLIGILVADILGIGVAALFFCINWKSLILDHKFQFVRPRLLQF